LRIEYEARPSLRACLDAARAGVPPIRAGAAATPAALENSERRENIEASRAS
jgi:hypothetical protein